MASIDIKSNIIEDYFEQANLLRERNDYEEAIEIYDKLIELDLSNFEAYYFKGYSFEALGRTTDGDINDIFEAVKAYDKAIEIKPDYAIAHQFKRILLENMSKIAKIKSREAFNEFYKLRPKMRELSNNKQQNCEQELKYKDLIYREKN